MKTALAFLFLSLCPILAAETAEALVDRLIIAPGDIDQICDAPAPIDPRLPLPIYRLVADRDVHLTPENLALLKQRRAEVVPVLVKKLAAYSFVNPPKKYVLPAKYKENPDVTNIDPRQISGLLYEMILGLEAVETLPELLRLEEQLRGVLAKADLDKKAPAPNVYMDGYITMPSGDKALSKRDQALSKGRVVQREMLSVMLQLLRAKKFQPLIDSDIEKTYGKALREQLEEDAELKDVKSPEDAKAKGLEDVEFDPIQKVPKVWIREHPKMPFNAELRNAIRGLVEQYIKTMPKAGTKKVTAK